MLKLLESGPEMDSLPNSSFDLKSITPKNHVERFLGQVYQIRIQRSLQY